MSTKVMRFQIIKPVDCDWNELGKILRDIQFETRQVLNKTIQICWEWQGFSSDYKKRYEVFPQPKDVLHYTLSGYCYSRISKDYTKLQTGNLSSTITRATQRWKTDLTDILKGIKSISNFRADVPIDLHNKSVHLFKEGEKYFANLSLLSKTYMKDMGRKSGQICVLLNMGDNSGKNILERCINGIYKIGTSQILHKKNKWFLNLSYSFKTESKPLDPDRILGIDMGIVYPVYMSIYNSCIREKIDGGEIERFRKQVERRKNEILRQGKYCGEGRIGHGSKTRMRPIEFAQDKVSNFRDTVNHKYSRYIVDFAERNRCGVIQMEDLKGISFDNTFLKNWTYHDLQQKIKYKAEERGIKVVLINPEYTSQRCSACGYIDRENRSNQSTFKCIQCGFETNADYNASKNISTPNIENIIKDSISANK